MNYADLDSHSRIALVAIILLSLTLVTLYVLALLKFKQNRINRDNPGCAKCLYPIQGWKSSICPECGSDIKKSGVKIKQTVNLQLKIIAVILISMALGSYLSVTSFKAYAKTSVYSSTTGICFYNSNYDINSPIATWQLDGVLRYKKDDAEIFISVCNKQYTLKFDRKKIPNPWPHQKIKEVIIANYPSENEEDISEASNQLLNLSASRVTRGPDWLGTSEYVQVMQTLGTRQNFYEQLPLVKTASIISFLFCLLAIPSVVYFHRDGTIPLNEAGDSQYAK